MLNGAELKIFHDIANALEMIADQLIKFNEMYRIVNASALRGSEVEKS